MAVLEHVADQQVTVVPGWKSAGLRGTFEGQNDARRCWQELVSACTPPETDREFRVALEALATDAIRIGGPDNRVAFMARSELLSTARAGAKT